MLLGPADSASGLAEVTPEHLTKFFGDDDVSTKGSAAWLYRAKERALYRQSLYAFTKSVICYQESPNLMTERSFKESCEWIQNVLVEWKCGLFEDPRNHIKSTRTTVAIPPWIAIQYTHPDYDHPAEIARQKIWLEAHTAMRGVDTRIVIAREK